MNPSRANTAIGVLTVTLTLIGWSSVPLFLYYFADSIDAWTSNGWRYGFSALLWAPVLIIGLFMRTLPRGLWRAAVVPSIINSASQVAFCYAHYKIEPGLVSFGLRSQLIFASIGAYVMFAAERPVIRSPGYLAGAAALLVGTAGAVLFSGEPLTGADAAGISLSITSGALFAGYALAVRRYLSGFNAVVAFAAISLYTAVAMVLLMVLLGRRGGLEVLAMPGRDIVLLLVSAVVGIALGHVFYYISIARLGVAVSSGVLQLHPFTVAVASWLVFGEILSIAQWASGTLAVCGAILMVLVQGRRGPLMRLAEKGIAGASRHQGIEASREEGTEAHCRW